jgi:hypothetical protein
MRGRVVNQAAATRLHLTIFPEQLPVFFPFLQQGVRIRAQVGCSVSELLVQHFGITPDYIRTRITTLFLNSRAIDKADEAIVGDGAVLALSGAMPGLVGATMRSGGYYAAMRSSISYQGSEEQELVREGTIRIKLFNLLLSELGGIILRQGILLPGPDLLAFFREQQEDFWKDCRKVLLNDRAVDPQLLKSEGLLPAGDGLVHLAISFRRRI